MKNQPCWLAEVRCGEVCGRTLKCGAHKCRKPCHRPGECEDSGQRCQQPCGKEKSCGHPCSDPCHAPSSCREDKPCQHKIFITCECQRIKQEARCNATKLVEGNRDKTLKCDEECARLERNRKLALALNIDQETHKDDHIPYSADTLNIFLSNIQWCQIQEKELRLFSADPDNKRLRFKPMPSQQRKFLHSLAEDFGFDSESMDPEPHRHIAIFKTPRFVSAPMKTLAECARIRNVQRAAMATAAATPAADAQPKKIKASNVVADPYNGFLITNARFALTVEELRAATRPVVATAPQLDLDIDFLPNEDVVLRPKSSSSVDERTTEALLTENKIALAKAVSSHGLGTLQLCRVDGSLNVLRRESDGASGGGWSQVAAKAASSSSRAPTVAPVGGKSSFTVLSSSASKRKKVAPTAAPTQLRKQESVVDDWERAEIEEEIEEEEREREKEREREAAAAGEGGSVGGSGDEGGEAAMTGKDGVLEGAGSEDQAGPSAASHTGEQDENEVAAGTGLPPDNDDVVVVGESPPVVQQQQQDAEPNAA
ncbi:hypothetical protein LTS18_011920 [Coniosporium uncinatum]|uniref:Uncharacterized protein n=1 Tax=Coniosporium uncinatum TaxID=93489 RepID=A0ACC3DWL6_9PEZI|nr:hypothetical protein LTS18_011920 [Coniosporium uncinatum]